MDICWLLTYLLPFSFSFGKHILISSWGTPPLLTVHEFWLGSNSDFSNGACDPTSINQVTAIGIGL